MKRIFWWFALLVLITAGVTAAQEDGLHVDVSQDLGKISPYVYGSNCGFYCLVPADLMPQAQDLGMHYVRMGGTYTDQQDVGKLAYDLFIAQTRAMGAEPALTVRLLGSTPEAAADMVRYINVEKKYNVKYWSIGNEPNFFVAVVGAESYTSEDLNRDWRAFAEAMLAVDPNIVFVGPDISQYVILNYDPANMQYLEGSDGGDPTDDLGKDWMQEFLKANGDLLGYVSIHRYAYPGLSKEKNPVATIEGLRDNSREWDTIIPNLRKLIKDTTGRDIPIAVTEVNSNSGNSMGGEASLDSVYNAIWFSDVLGRLIKQKVDIVLTWNLQGADNSGWGVLGKYDVRPMYYVYMLYKQFGTELVFSESSDPYVSIYAAKRDDGTLTLMVVNLGDDEATKNLKIDGFTPSGDADVWRFDDEHKAEQVDAADVSSSITVPGRSLTLYVVPGQ
jgi:alpha-L-arabinofuranosidase